MTTSEATIEPAPEGGSRAGLWRTRTRRRGTLGAGGAYVLLQCLSVCC